MLTWLKQLFCIHNFTILSSQKLVNTYRHIFYEIPLGEPFTRPITTIIRQCNKCDKLEQKNFTGHHELK